MAAVVLLSIGAGVVAGHAAMWRQTVEKREGQDFGIFLTSVRHAAAGRSLYTPTYYRSRTTPKLVTGPPNLNLPHTLVLLLPLAWLPASVALGIWMGVSALSLAVCTWRTVRLLGWRVPWLAALAIGVYLIAWAPAAAFTLTAQISLLLMWPVCAAWWAYRSGEARRGGAWLGLAAAIKPFLLLFVPYLVLRRDWTALRAFAIAIAGVASSGLLIFGPAAYGEWLAQLPQVSWAGHYLNASWLSLAVRAFARSDFAPVIALPGWAPVVGLVGAVVIGVITLRQAGRRTETLDARRRDHEWATILSAALLMSPLGWSYYFWIALLPVAATIAHRAPWRRPRPADLWLVPGVIGWMWWGRMTEWGQPHPLATLLCASMYFWALWSLWAWLVASPVPAVDTTPARGGD